MFYSKLFFKKVNFTNIILILFLIIIPIQIFAFTQAFLISIYIYILYTIFFIKSSIDLINYKRIIKLKNNFSGFFLRKEYIFINLISLLISILFTYKLWPNVWRFEDHDVLYFGWLNGIYNIDYFGSIRIPTAYPEMMSANHLMAGSLLIPFLAFCKTNLINSIFVKCILIFSSLFNYLKTFNIACLNVCSNNKFKSLIVCNLIFIASFTFLSSELMYSLGFSNYPIIILVLCLANYLIGNIQKDGNESHEFFRKILFFITLISISKAVTFPLFALGIVFVLIHYKHELKINQVLNKRNLVYFSYLLFIVILSIISWKLKLSNHGSLGGAFPICIIDGASQAKDCFSSVFKNPFGDWTIPSNHFLLIQKIIPLSKIPGISEYIYIWIISIIPTAFIGYYLNKKSQIYRFKLFGMFVKYYSLATACGVVLIRMSKGYDGLGTAHGYLIMPVFILTSFHMIYLDLIKENQKILKIKNPLLFLVIPILIYYFSAWSPNTQRLSDLKRGDINETDRISFTLDDFKKFEIKDNVLCTSDIEKKLLFENYLDGDCSDKYYSNDALHLYYSMKGLRTNAALKANQAQIKQWVLN